MEKTKLNLRETIKNEWLLSVSNNTADLNKLVLDYLNYEGLGDIALKFAENVSLNFNKSKFLDQRTEIRKTIEMGDIDKAITLINDLDSEIIDCNVDLYYFLLQQKALEKSHIFRSKNLMPTHLDYYTNLEEILEFVRLEITGIVDENSHLLVHLENLLEFIIFNSKDESIFVKRRQVAEYVNKTILDKYDVIENELIVLINEMLITEKNLISKSKCNTFNEKYL